MTLIELARSIGIGLGLDVEDRNRGAPAIDFLLTSWLSIALLLFRIVTERAIIPLLSKALKDKKKARNVFDDAFISVF